MALRVCRNKIFNIFAVRTLQGTVAEWLGSGLQNRVQRFESARYLNKKAP